MSVRDNIEAGKYRNTVPYSPPDLVIDPEKVTIAEAARLKEKHKADRAAQRKAWSEGEGAATALFRADLEAEEGLTGHPKADALWRIAWDRGHSSGYSEILECYEQMVELLK